MSMTTAGRSHVQAISEPFLWRVAACALVMLTGAACASRDVPENALYQETGEAGSTIPKAHAPYYPNTAGNIVAPPGNPGGNQAGSPPLVGGNMNQTSGWPEGR